MAMRVPLVILAALSIVGGFLQLPDTLGGLPLFSDFLHTILPALQVVRGNLNTELALQLAAAAASLGGIYAAYLLWLRHRQVAEQIVKTPLGRALYRFWFVGWGFDWLDNEFIVRPFVWLAKTDKDDVVDLIYRGLARLAWVLNRLLILTQVGQVRRYALGIAIGAAIVTGMVVLL
jgi:NADH-quinone oxidoreductase subunit L